MRRKVKPIHYKNIIKRQTNKKIKLIEKVINIDNEIEELLKVEIENKKKLIKLISKQKMIIQTINEINESIFKLEYEILNK